MTMLDTLKTSTLAFGRRLMGTAAAAALGLGLGLAVIAGAPGTVADELERWREEAGVDGWATTNASSAAICRNRSMRAEEWSGPWPS